MSTMDELKVETKTIDVELELSDGGRLAGSLFLRLYSSHHSGAEHVGDLLNDAAEFFPVKMAQGVQLINRRHVRCVRVAARMEQDELMTLGAKHRVSLSLNGGGLVEGDIYVDLPEALASRVKDYFNQSHRFFPVFSSGVIVYINAREIVAVRD